MEPVNQDTCNKNWLSRMRCKESLSDENLMGRWIQLHLVLYDPLLSSQLLPSKQIWFFQSVEEWEKSFFFSCGIMEVHGRTRSRVVSVTPKQLNVNSGFRFSLHGTENFEITHTRKRLNIYPCWQIQVLDYRGNRSLSRETSSVFLTLFCPIVLFSLKFNLGQPQTDLAQIQQLFVDLYSHQIRVISCFVAVRKKSTKAHLFWCSLVAWALESVGKVLHLWVRHSVQNVQNEKTMLFMIFMKKLLFLLSCKQICDIARTSICASHWSVFMAFASFWRLSVWWQHLFCFVGTSCVLVAGKLNVLKMHVKSNVMHLKMNSLAMLASFSVLLNILATNALCWGSRLIFWMEATLICVNKTWQIVKRNVVVKCPRWIQSRVRDPVAVNTRFELSVDGQKCGACRFLARSAATWGINSYVDVGLGHDTSGKSTDCRLPLREEEKYRMSCVPQLSLVVRWWCKGSHTLEKVFLRNHIKNFRTLWSRKELCDLSRTQ